MPPTEPMPIDCRSSLPSPPPSAIGNMPTSAAAQLISTGRNFNVAAIRTSPVCRQASMIRIAAFTTTPTSMMPARSPKIESVWRATTTAAKMPR